MKLNSGESMITEWRGRDAPSIGDRLSLSVESSNIHLFDAKGVRIG
jgi:hypothetical protein